MPEIDGQPHPLVDTAGYAPFGFRLPSLRWGNTSRFEFVKEYLRTIWREKISFQKLDNRKRRRECRTNPHTVLNDDVHVPEGELRLMQYADYKCFRFAFDSGVAFVSINHPPINLSG